MKWGLFVLIAALLVTPASAISVSFWGAPQTIKQQCVTRSDCSRLARTVQVICAQGSVFNPQPDCYRGECVWCRPTALRPTIDCRYDNDCTIKTTCLRGLAARCQGSKCICALPRPECVNDRDCARPAFLNRQNQRLVCDKNKCVTPKPLVTSLPRSWTQPVR